MQPATFGAGAHGGEGAIEGVRWQAGKRNTGSGVCRSCHINCIDKDKPWKSCCTIPYSYRTGADLPIIASGVLTVKVVCFCGSFERSVIYGARVTVPPTVLVA